MEEYDKPEIQTKQDLKKIGKTNIEKRRKKMRILLIIQLCLIVIVGICLYAFVKFYFVYFRDSDTGMIGSKQGQPVEVEAVIEKVIEEPIVEEPLKDRIVEGINISGLSIYDAKSRLISSYDWNIKVEYNGQSIVIENFLLDSIDVLLNDIYTNDKYGTFELEITNVKTLIKEVTATLALKWDKKAKNAQITKYDRGNNEFLFSSEVQGVAINQEKLGNDLFEAVKSKNYAAIIDVEGIAVEPDISLKQAKKLYKVIGYFETTTTKDSNRNNNIKLASDALNGLIIEPGDEFSFNNTTGNRTVEAGYKPAGAYRDGLFVQEPGGGVCQVSSTLYNAVIFSGVKMTERNAHTFEPSYVNPGEDAMVSYDGYSGPDMKFINQSDTAVAILSTFEDQKLSFSIYGIPILEKGVTISMQSEKVKELPPPEPTYKEVKTLKPGTEEIVKEAINGSQWITNLIIKKNGEIISNEYFHRSNYRGTAAIINRNSSNITPEPIKEKNKKSKKKKEN